MATVPEPRARRATAPELHSGDRMTREEFHRIYEKTEGIKAELVGGTVYVASPLTRGHGRNHLPLGALFYLYEAQTPGVESGDNVTVQLGAESELQPDLYLLISPECGGQSRTSDDDYVEGPPALIAEVAHSSRAIDLHAKREDYARHGVKEYLVLCVREGELRWFDLQADQELQPDPDGVLRLRSFPGLWIHRPALLTRDHKRLMDTLHQGLASPEHADFVARLSSKRMRDEG